MSICLLTGYDDRFARIGEITTPSKRNFAARYGWHLQVHRQYNGEHPSWAKLRLVQEQLETHHTVVWLDADSIITNQEINPLERCRQGLNVSEDWNPLDQPSNFSMGNFVATRESLPLFLAAQELTHHRDGIPHGNTYDQAAMRQLYQQNPEARRLITIHPRRFLNAVDGMLRPGAIEPWQSGDWLCHLTTDYPDEIVPQATKYKATGPLSFSHHGTPGDIIYSLAAFRYLGGGDFHLFGMQDHYIKTIWPLLESQSFIRNLTNRGDPGGPAPNSLSSLTWIHHHQDYSCNLADQICNWLGLPHWPRHLPWLDAVQPNPIAPVVINKTPRYTSPHFPWQEMHRRYAEQAIFIGHREEHQSYCSEVGEIAYYQTKTLLQVAEVIEGCQLFIGNPSSPLSIAEGRKKNVLVASHLPKKNAVHWQRQGHIHVYPNTDIQWPVLENK